LAANPPDETLTQRARRYLGDLIRLDSTYPPGNETRVAKYLKQVADAEGIESELLGDNPDRLNFVARLRGSGSQRPLLLMAHSDVVPADPSLWSVPPYSGAIRDGFIYGRGAEDDKSLLAAEMAILVDLKRRGLKLQRDVIVLSESDEETGSTGIRWLLANAPEKIDAEFALNEGGHADEVPDGHRLFHIQTAEKIPTRITLTARGSAGHGSVPRPDNAVVTLARALVRLADTDQPVRLNTTTRRYLGEAAKLPDYQWLGPLVGKLESAGTAPEAANQIRLRQVELAALLRTTVSPTMLNAGTKINVIPNTAQARVDIRRLPDESRAEVLDRIRRIVNDSAVEVTPAGGQEMPPAEPSSLTTSLYIAMERVFRKHHPKAVVLPYMALGATDGAFLRSKGMAVYGVPVFVREENASRAHGNDERISLKTMDEGTALLMEIVASVVQ